MFASKFNFIFSFFVSTFSKVSKKIGDLNVEEIWFPTFSILGKSNSEFAFAKVIFPCWSTSIKGEGMASKIFSIFKLSFSSSFKMKLPLPIRFSSLSLKDLSEFIYNQNKVHENKIKTGIK